MSDPDVHEARIGFYRRWSSEAAQRAMASDKRVEVERCSHCADMWTRIADAIEGGESGQADYLTRNLLLLENGARVMGG